MPRIFHALFVLGLALGASPAGRAGEPENLLQNPRFERVGGNGLPTSWQLRVADGNKGRVTASVVADADLPGKVLRLATAPDQPVADGNWMSQQVPAAAQRKYVLDFRAKAEVGVNDLDHSVSVGVAFLTGEGKWIGYQSLVPLAKHSERWKNTKLLAKNRWEAYRREFVTPPATGKILLRLNLFGDRAGVSASFADLSLREPGDTIAAALDRVPVPKTFAVTLRPVSAAGITVTPDWGLADAETLRSTHRTEISLNGLWALAVPGADGALPETVDWAFHKIPGRLGVNRNPFAIYGNDAGYDWKRSPLRWLWRTVALPEAPDPARRYFVRIGSLWTGAAKVFWNGTALGTLTDQWGGEVEIPAGRIKPGANTLALLLTGQKINETTMHQIRAGNVPDVYEPDFTPNVGDVSLLARPAVDACGDVRVTPSFRNQTLSVATPDMAKRAARYAITVKDARGETVLRAENPAPEPVGVTVPWAEPVLWTPETPRLLYLTLSAFDADGTMTDQSLPVRFGFRELWTEGKELVFNGQPIRLRPRMGLYAGGTVLSEGYARRGIAFLKDMGFNTLLRPGNERGDGDLIRAADEMGLFVFGYLPTALADGGQFGDLKTQPIDDALLDWLDRHPIGRFHNNPSMVAYSGFGAMMPISASTKYSNHPALWGVEPIKDDATIGRLLAENITSDRNVLRRQAAVISFIRAVARLDGSRPFLNHVGCGTGDGWGSYSYFNHLEPQEWEDYPVEWTRRGVQPIGATEHGLPYAQSFVNHGVPDGDQEPWHTEYAAARLGETAYRMERPEFRALIGNLYDAKKGNYSRGGRHGHGANGYTFREPVVQAFWAEHNRRIFRAWRWYGVNMGIEPFGDPRNYVREEALEAPHGKVIVTGREPLKRRGAVPDRYLQNDYFRKESLPDYPERPTGKKPAGLLTPLGETLYANNRPFLGFIADTAERPTAKTHLFAPGERVTKSAALIWDGLSPTRVRVSLSVDLEGRTLFAEDREVALASNAREQSFFAFTVPDDAGGSLAQPARGEIRARFRHGDEETEDAFAFSVVAPPAPHGRRVVLFDPENTAGAMRAFAAAVVTEPRALAGSGAELVMIAPGALRAGLPEALPARTPVLALAQDMATLEGLGFKTHPIRSRRLWADTAFPVDSELLRDWRAGKPFTRREETEPWREGHNNYIGSTGMVAGVLIETPHFGDFTPRVHGGFDLALTALLETRIGDRPWLFCQLALAENAGEDPAAKALAAYLTGEFGKTPSPRRAVRLWRKDDGLAERLGLRIAGTGLPAGDGEILLVDRMDADEAEAVRAYVRKGGAAVLMPQDEAVYAALGIAAKTTRGALFEATTHPGLNLGNFHYRQEQSAVTFGQRVLATQDDGAGRWILVGFDPRRLDTAAEPYLAWTKRRQYRSLSQALATAGAAFDGEALAARIRLSPRPFVVAPENSVHPLRATVADDLDWRVRGYVTLGWDTFRMGIQTTGLPDAQVRMTFHWTEKDDGDWILDAGTFDDYDTIWLNGERLGGVTPENSEPEKAWRTRRRYPVRQGLLRQGENVLAIHTWNRNGKARGWPAQIRGPLHLVRDGDAPPALYEGQYRASDDPYQLRQW